MRALANGTGKYLVSLTDKDSIEERNIGFVIEALRRHEFACGFFALDYTGTETRVHYATSLLDCFKNFAYLSKHPTGYIFKHDLIRELEIEKRFSDTKTIGFFPFEFLSAELCMHRRSAYFAIPFCITAKLVSGQQSERSMTYSSGKRNLFLHRRIGLRCLKSMRCI